METTKRRILRAGIVVILIAMVAVLLPQNASAQTSPTPDDGQALAPEIQIRGERSDRRLSTVTINGEKSSAFYVDLITVPVHSQHDLDDVFSYIDGTVIDGSVVTGAVDIHLDPHQASVYDFAPLVGQAGIGGPVAFEQIDGVLLMTIVYQLRAEGILASAVAADPSSSDAATHPLFNPNDEFAGLAMETSETPEPQGYKVLRLATARDLDSAVVEDWQGVFEIEDPTLGAEVRTRTGTLDGEQFETTAYVKDDRAARLVRAPNDVTIGFVAMDATTITMQFDFDGDRIADLVNTTNLTTLEETLFFGTEHLSLIHI